MKILACDYDGTLNVCGTVSKENLEAIDKWRAAGNLFGMVSGRYIASIREFLQKDNVPYDFLIGNNGSVITDSAGKIIKRICIPHGTAMALLQEIFQYEAHHVSVSYDEKSLWVTARSRIWTDGQGLHVDDACIKYVTQVSANFFRPEDAIAVRDACVTAFSGQIHGMMPTIQSIDFNHASVDKAAGIRRLLEMRGIAPDVILTVGDGENDLAMLEAPDLCGYAMESAMPMVLERVSRRTKSVAALIEAYL